MATKKKSAYKAPKIDFRPSPVGIPYIKSQTSGGDSSIGGIGTPPPVDFAKILAEDPYYQAALANLNAAGIYDKGSRDQAIKQAMIRFGYAPEAVAGMTFPEPVLGQPGHQQPRSLADILDPATRSLAQQNTTAGLSIWARLLDAAKQSDKRTVDVLGSRGLFRSGETGYQLKRGALAADQARYDATNKLMDFLTGAQAAYVQAEMQRQALLLQAQRQAAEDASANPAPPLPPTPPGVPHPPAPPPAPHGPGPGPGPPPPNPDSTPSPPIPPHSEGQPAVGGGRPSGDEPWIKPPKRKKTPGGGMYMPQ